MLPEDAAPHTPSALSIAGFDPSAGAGVLADIKTFQALDVYGFAACSAVTAQNENNFRSISWIAAGAILEQLEALLECYRFEAVKIGIVESLLTLELLLDFLRERAPGCKIVWDPVLAASSGFAFHGSLDKESFEALCAKIFVLTPNFLEMRQIYPECSPLDAARILSRRCAVLLKGGHEERAEAIDRLFWREECFEFPAERVAGQRKHGSGCAHSSALAAFLAKGASLDEAAPAAQKYCGKFLESGPGLLGYHHLDQL